MKEAHSIFSGSVVILPDSLYDIDIGFSGRPWTTPTFSATLCKGRRFLHAVDRTICSLSIAVKSLKVTCFSRL